MRLLLVEDDKEISAALVEGLRERGLRVDTADSFDTGRMRALAATYDVIVLDVMLPGGSGFELCRVLRRSGVATHILMLTARDAVNDRVEGLEAGADDYLTKPFAFAELIARIRALTRRPLGIAPEVVRIADLEVELGARRVMRAGRPIELTAKEFALLECFIRYRDRVVDRAAITAYVWDENHDPFTNVLEVLIRRLRRKIDEGYAPPLIHTVRGAGYRFGV
ncbi:MAG TPA: response regulator transcription factor [Gemmatimonadaceae bacterium]|nr:response regulator transcription factor [Gemmatimonadaceae bacterium]